MDRTIKLWLNILLFVFLVLILSFTIALNNKNMETLLVLASILVTSVSIRYLFLYESKKFYNIGIASICIDTVIVYIMNNIDTYGICRMFYLVLIGETIIFYPIILGIIAWTVGFLIFLIITYVLNKSATLFELPSYFASGILSVIFISFIMSIVKYVINQHSRLDRTMKELEAAHEQLKETSKQLEKMAIIKERNRIAGEVHDTIGHTLTTVLVEIEAGKRIMKKDTDKALYKLELAQEEVRKGLGDISKSIKTISNGSTDFENFESSVKKIVKETQIHTGVKIKCQFENISNVPKTVGEVLLKALKEGITNGIRHGKCYGFTLQLSLKNNFTTFRLVDNGIGCKKLDYGFGLTTMKERVEGVGGSISLYSEPGKGSCLELIIPFRKEE